MRDDAWSAGDRDFMLAALAEAAIAAEEGEVPVGAVVVVGGEIIGRGHNRSITSNDPSAHAEIVALRAAGQSIQNYRLGGASGAAQLFVTLEPCAMCTGAIAHARVGRVVFGAYDSKAGAMGSAIDLAESKALQHRLEINGGLLADESSALLQEFFRARR